MARKKSGKKKGRGVESDSDGDVNIPLPNSASAVEELPPPPVAAKSKKKAKKAAKKQQQLEQQEEEQEEEVQIASDENEENDPYAQVVATTKAKKAKKDKKKKKVTIVEEENEEELVDEMENLAVEEEEEEEEEEKKVKKEKKKKDRKKKSKDEDVEEGGGKRLSNKEKRKLREEENRKKRDEEYHRAANPLDGSQFSVSQQAFNEDSTWEYSTDIHIDNFTINAHNKLLFENASLNINAGGKYGLVGPNGQGKTTLLKMIALKELKIPPKIDCLYVEQEVVADQTRAVDAVLKADAHRWQLLEEEKKLLKELEEKSDEQKDERLNEVYELLAVTNAEAAEARARKILFGLGFDSIMQEKPTKEFSGGWRMRISLAKALFMEPTLLMLDEPTNHLDLNAVIWLDDYLQKWKKTILIVSHDADFLNSVCSEILHLEDKKLISYKGNYDQFREMEKQKRKQQQKAWEKQQKQLRNLKTSGKSSKKATEIVKKKQREPGARAAKGKKNNPSGMEAGGTDEASGMELLKRPREYTVKFSFPETTQLTPPILEVKEVDFRYSEDHPYLFKGIDFGIDTDSRVCIVGPNGVGKSTLLKLITGDLYPKVGEIRRNHRVRVGVYNQHFVDKLPMGETPVEYLRRLFQGKSYQEARNLLGKVGLEGHAHEIKNRLLSGGQKARVVLAELILMNPHILVLDEPTNNLDIESIDALCEALDEFDGGVVVVTHDARLIEATNCLLWVVGNEEVIEYNGTFDDYRQEILDDLSKLAEAEDAKLQEKAEKRQAAKDERLKRIADAKKITATSD